MRNGLAPNVCNSKQIFVEMKRRRTAATISVQNWVLCRNQAVAIETIASKRNSVRIKI